MNEKFEFRFMGTELDQFGVRFLDLIFVKHEEATKSEELLVFASNT